MNPPKSIFFGIIIAVLVTGILFVGSSQQTSAATDYTIPAWVKGIAGFWVDDKISDQEFGEGLSFLIDNDVIKVPEMEKLQQENSQLKSELRELQTEFSAFYELATQGFFSSTQISGTPQIEAIQILGYDARAVQNLLMHDGNNMVATSGDFDSNLEADERVAIYVTNNSVQKIVLGEITLGGFTYSYANVNAIKGPGVFDTTDKDELRSTYYTVLTSTNGGDLLLNEEVGEIQPGQTVTIILDLESDLRIGRSSQFKLTTSNGNVFVATISVGQQSG